MAELDIILSDAHEVAMFHPNGMKTLILLSFICCIGALQAIEGAICAITCHVVTSDHEQSLLTTRSVQELDL